MQSFGLVIFTLVWSAGVLFFDSMMAGGIVKQYQAGHYPVVIGTVTDSKLTTYDRAKGGTGYEAAIRYRYEVGGESFAGNRLRYGVAASDSASARSALSAFPKGAAVQVFYNPRDPQDSLLSPGISGDDLFLVLFSTPFNAVVLGLWIWIGGWVRERIFGPVAGGVKIISDGRYTRVRLPQWAAVFWGLATAGGLAFISMFVIGFAMNGSPPMALILPVIGTVYMAGVLVFLWRWLKIRSGYDDLVLNATARTLELPPTWGRKQRLTAAMADIEGLTVDEIVHTGGKGGRSYTYAPTLLLRGTEAGQQKLAEWSDKLKASDFADWLRQQLRL